MSTTSAATATATAARTISPTRMFFRTSRTIPSMAHARSVFKQLGEYGEMVEYKFLRVIYIYIYTFWILLQLLSIKRNVELTYMCILFII